MWQHLRGAWWDEEGVMSVEYAVLLALLVVAAISTWTMFGNVLEGKIASSSNQMNAIQ